MLAEVTERKTRGQGRLGQCPSGVGDEDLPSVGSGGDPRRAIDVEADVIVAAECSQPSVQAHPDANRRRLWPGGRRQLPLCGGRGSHRRGRLPEQDEEGIALRSTFDAAMRLERSPQDAVVTFEELCENGRT